MKKLLTLSENTTLGFSIISILGFIYNLVFYIKLQIRTLNLGPISQFIDQHGMYVAILMIFMLVFHISAILTIILKLKIHKRDSIILSFTFFISIISLIMLFGDYALINDITKEYIAGLIGIESEFVILYFSQFAHILFYCMTLIFLTLDKKEYRFYHISEKEVPLKDEAIFTDAQYIGIFTSILGLFILASLSVSSPLWAIKKGIVIVCVMIVIPYITIVIYWLLIKIRERITEWYDEKQFQDVTKSGFVSFLSSIAILAIFFVIQNTVKKFELLNVIWFPLYFFISLLIFSGVILYLSKKSAS